MDQRQNETLYENVGTVWRTLTRSILNLVDTLKRYFTTSKDLLIMKYSTKKQNKIEILLSCINYFYFPYM